MLAAKGLCVVLLAHTALQIAAEITKDSIEVDLPNQEFRTTRLKESFLVHRARRSDLENGSKGTGKNEANPKNSGGLFGHFVNWITNRNSDKTEDEEEGSYKSLIDLQLNIKPSKITNGSGNMKNKILDNTKSPGKEKEPSVRPSSKPDSEGNGRKTPRTEERHETTEDGSSPRSVPLKPLLDFSPSLETENSEEISTEFSKTNSPKAQNVKGSTNNNGSSSSEEQPIVEGQPRSALRSNRHPSPKTEERHETTEKESSPRSVPLTPLLDSDPSLETESSEEISTEFSKTKNPKGENVKGSTNNNDSSSSEEQPIVEEQPRSALRSNRHPSPKTEERHETTEKESSPLSVPLKSLLDFDPSLETENSEEISTEFSKTKSPKGQNVKGSTNNNGSSRSEEQPIVEEQPRSALRSNRHPSPKTEERHETTEKESSPLSVPLKSLLDFNPSLETESSEEISTEFSKTKSPKGENVKGSTNNNDSSSSEEQPIAEEQPRSALRSNRHSNGLKPAKTLNKILNDAKKVLTSNENFDSSEKNDKDAKKYEQEMGNSDVSDKKRKLLKSLLDFDDSEEDRTEEPTNRINTQPESSFDSNDSSFEEKPKKSIKKEVTQIKNQEVAEKLFPLKASIGEKSHGSTIKDKSDERSEEREIKPLNQKKKNNLNEHDWNQHVSPKLGFSVSVADSPRKGKKIQGNAVRSNLNQLNIPKIISEEIADNRNVNAKNQDKMQFPSKSFSVPSKRNTGSGRNVDFYETKRNHLKGLLSFGSSNENNISALSAGPTSTVNNGLGGQSKGPSLRSLLNNVGKAGNSKISPRNSKNHEISLNLDISGLITPFSKNEKNNWLDLSLEQLITGMPHLESENDINDAAKGDAGTSKKRNSRIQGEQSKPTKFSGYEDVGNLNSLLSFGGVMANNKRSKSLHGTPSYTNSRYRNSKALLPKSKSSISDSSEEEARAASNGIALRGKLRPGNLNSASQFGFKSREWKPRIDSKNEQVIREVPLERYGFKESGGNLRGLLNIGKYGDNDHGNLKNINKSNPKERNSPKTAPRNVSEEDLPTERHDGGKRQSYAEKKVIVSGPSKKSLHANGGKESKSPNEGRSNKKHGFSSKSGDLKSNDSNENIPGKAVSAILRRLTNTGLLYGLNLRRPNSLSNKYLQNSGTYKSASSPYLTETLIDTEDAYPVKGNGEESGSGAVHKEGDLSGLLYGPSFGRGSKKFGDYTPTGFSISEYSLRSKSNPSGKRQKTESKTPSSKNINQKKGTPNGESDGINATKDEKTPVKSGYRNSFGSKNRDPSDIASNKNIQYPKGKNYGVSSFEELPENSKPGDEGNPQNTRAKENSGDKNGSNYINGNSGSPEYSLFGKRERPSERTGYSINKDISSTSSPNKYGGSENDGFLLNRNTPVKKSESGGLQTPKEAKRKVSSVWRSSNLYDPSIEDNDSAAKKITENKVLPSNDQYSKNFGGLNLNYGKPPQSNRVSDGQPPISSPDLQSNKKDGSSNWAGSPAVLNGSNRQRSKYLSSKTSDDQYPESNEDSRISPYSDRARTRDGTNNWSENPSGLDGNNWRGTWETSDEQSPQSNGGLTVLPSNDQSPGKDRRNNWSGTPAVFGKNRVISKYWTWETSDDQPSLSNRGLRVNPLNDQSRRREKSVSLSGSPAGLNGNNWQVSNSWRWGTSDYQSPQSNEGSSAHLPNDQSLGWDESDNWSESPAGLNGNNWQVSKSWRWETPDNQPSHSNGDYQVSLPSDQSGKRNGYNNWPKNPAETYEKSHQVRKSWRWETSGDDHLTPDASMFLEYPERKERWESYWSSQDYTDEDSDPEDNELDWDNNESNDYASGYGNEGDLSNNAWGLELPSDFSFSDRQSNVDESNLVPGGQQSFKESTWDVSGPGEKGLKNKKEQNENPSSNPTSGTNSKKVTNSDSPHGTGKSFSWNLNLSAQKDQQGNNRALKWNSSSIENGLVNSKGEPNIGAVGGNAINNSSAQILQNTSNVLGNEADEWTITARANFTGLGTTILDGIRNGITNLRSNAADLAGNAVKNVISATSKGVKAVAETGQKGLQWGQNIFNWMKNAGQKAWDAGKNVVQKAVDGASKIAKKGMDLGSRAIQGISNLGGAASSGLKKLSDFADNSAKDLTGMVDNAVKSTKNSDIPFSEALEAGRKLTRNLVAEASVKVNRDGHYRDFNFNIGGSHSENK